jgi:hypothetical protein
MIKQDTAYTITQIEQDLSLTLFQSISSLEELKFTPRGT